jgi:hypothetical protein
MLLQFSLLFIAFVLFVWAITWFVLFIFNQVVYGYGVPYVPTPDYKIQKLIDIIQMKKNAHFLDIWCGDGRVVEALKREFPHVECSGIENSYYPYFLAQRRRRKSSVSYSIIKWNLFKMDISNYDVIYCYLLPVHMKRVWEKISSECKVWTLLYSSAFEIADKKPKEKILIQDQKYFYVYEV